MITNLCLILGGYACCFLCFFVLGNIYGGWNHEQDMKFDQWFLFPFMEIVTHARHMRCHRDLF